MAATPTFFPRKVSASAREAPFRVPAKWLVKSMTVSGRNENGGAAGMLRPHPTRCLDGLSGSDDAEIEGFCERDNQVRELTDVEHWVTDVLRQPKMQWITLP